MRMSGAGNQDEINNVLTTEGPKKTGGGKRSRLSEVVREAVEINPTVKKPRLGTGLAVPPQSKAGQTPVIASKQGQSVKSPGSFQRVQKKFTLAYHPGNLSTDSHWSFVLSTARNEWIRLSPDSVSAVVYGTYLNPTYAAGGATDEIKTQYHALQAGKNKPLMYVDPSVQGTGFVKQVEVLVNKTPVYTNEFNSHLIHYARMSRVFCGRPEPFFNTTSDLLFTDAKPNAITRHATRPFDMGSYNSKQGVRVPIYLHGVWPFEAKNNTLETIDRKSEDAPVLPPGTTLEIRLITYPNHSAGIFHSGITSLVDYLNTEQAVVPPENPPQISFREVVLSYESSVLTEADHLRMYQALQAPNGSNVLGYIFDIPRSQNQTLAANQSYTENSFVVPPYCRLIYLLFQPTYAGVVLEHKHKPLSGLSSFPKACSKISIEFAGEKQLECNELVNFGSNDSVHEIEKWQYFKYLKDRNLVQRMDQIFPRGETSVNGVLLYDLRHFMSSKSEILKIRLEFAAGSTSPANQQLVLLSVHPNGRAICQSGGSTNDLQWKIETFDYTLDPKM